MTISQMYNPLHPGEVLRGSMGEMSVTALAKHLHVSRIIRSRILNSAAGISADMSLRLSEAMGMQATLHSRTVHVLLPPAESSVLKPSPDIGWPEDPCSFHLQFVSVQ
jgi:addiction module HigA family antidote